MAGRTSSLDFLPVAQGSSRGACSYKRPALTRLPHADPAAHRTTIWRAVVRAWPPPILLCLTLERCAAPCILVTRLLAPAGVAKKRSRVEKPPLSPDSVARWNLIDPQLLNPDFAKQFIGMSEAHLQGLSPSTEVGSSGTSTLDAAPAESCQHLNVPPGALFCPWCGSCLPRASSGEAASSSSLEPPELSPPEPAADAWLAVRTYENMEDAISDDVISLMQEHTGPLTVFTIGMVTKTDMAGGLAAHRAMFAQLQHEASRLPGGLTDANFNTVCFATLAHADAKHMINAGSGAEYTTDKTPAPLFSQTLHVTLEDGPNGGVRLSRGGGGRAFSPQELEAVLIDPKVPACTKALIELGTASTIPGWHEWSLAVTRNRPCVMEQWRVADGPTVAPRQAMIEFPNRGISGAQEIPVFRAQSTAKGRLGVQHAVFHVLGFSVQFCCLPIYALIRFGVVVGNPQHGGDAHVISIDRHGEVIQQQSLAGAQP
jgi:hypothetical protein